jgi:hypothetical protein
LPRDQVRRYYLQAVEKARDEGVVRPPHKTPLEFAEELGKEWPDAEADVDELTAAFLDARYSDHPIGDSAATGAESIWRRLLHELRRRRNSETP